MGRDPAHELRSSVTGGGRQQRQDLCHRSDISHFRCILGYFGLYSIKMAAIFVTMDLDIAMSMASLTNIRYDGQPMQWKQHNAVQILADGWLNLNFSSGGDQISEVNFYRARWISSLCKLHNRIHHHLHHREETVSSLQLLSLSSSSALQSSSSSSQWWSGSRWRKLSALTLSPMSGLWAKRCLRAGPCFHNDDVIYFHDDVGDIGDDFGESVCCDWYFKLLYLHRSESGAVVIWANPRCHNLLSLNQHVWHWQYRWQYQQHFTNLVQILDNIRTNWFVHHSSIEE